MTGSKEGLRGLKEHAQETIFKDWHVTPEMKADLAKGIRRAERTRATPARTWRISPAAGIAVAALVLVIGFAGYQGMPGHSPTQGQTNPAASAPRAGTTPPASPAPNPVWNGDTITIAPTNSVQFTVAPASVDTVVTNAMVTDQSRNVTLTDSYGNAVSGSPVAGPEVEPGRRIVLNADYLLQVKDAPAVVEEVQRLAVSSGGYVVEANVGKNDDASYSGRLVLRIPATSFNQAILQIRRFGEVKQEKQWSQDVTDRYADLQARIKIQQEMEQKLLELAQKAATFDDWLKLTKQINETRAQMESLQGSLKQLANQVEYSTLTIAVVQPAPGQVEKLAAPASFWQALGHSFMDSVKLLGRFGQGVLLGLTAAAPFLLSLLLGGGGILYAIRRWRHRQS